MAKFFTYAGGTQSISQQFLKDVEKQRMNKYRMSLNFDVGTITDRSDIINPSDYIDISQYTNDAYGRSLYQSDLLAAQTLAKQQEAAYLDWFNSPEQVAQRERDAGLNPNLVGLEGAAAGVQTDPSSGSPLENVMSDEQIRAQKIQNISSILSGVSSLIGTISSVGGLVNSFAQIGLTKSQTQQSELTNANLFQQLVHKDVSGRVANAMSSAMSLGKVFSMDDFFGNADNFSGIFESYAPADNPQYRSLYDSTLKQTQSLLGQAFTLNKDTASNQSDFARLVSNPYYSDDIVLQVGMLEPVMQGIENFRLVQQEFDTFANEMRLKYSQGIDIQSAIDASNAQFEANAVQANYNEDYYSQLDGEEQARYDALIKKSQSILDNIEASVRDNLFQIWDKNKSTQRGLSAAYMLLGQTPMSLKEWIAMSITAPRDVNPSTGSGSLKNGITDVDKWMDDFKENGSWVD